MIKIELGKESGAIRMLLPENIAYTAAYQKMRENAMPILTEENFTEERTTALSNGDIIVFRNYVTMEDPYRRSGSRFYLKRNGKIVYSYCMPIDAGDLVSQEIIKHRNGNQYILFRTELYGYSLLDLNSLKAWHYIPKGRIKNRESFIWADGGVYCERNNLLYISGCYWAYPYSVLIVDFSQPEALPYREYNLMETVDVFEDDIEPIQWEADGSLTYKIGQQQYILPEKQLLELLKNQDGRRSLDDAINV